MKKQVHYKNGALFSEVWIEDNEVKVELFHPVKRKFETAVSFLEHDELMMNTYNIVSNLAAINKIDIGV